MMLRFDRSEESPIPWKTDLELESQTLERFHLNFRIIYFLNRTLI